jgi:O-antigen/teichoic acid export membrane protein
VADEGMLATFFVFHIGVLLKKIKMFSLFKATYSNDSQTQKSLRNASWNSIDYLVLPLLWIICTPFFVRHLGVDHYGIWMLVNAFLGLTGVLGFGLADAVVKYVSRYRATNDEHKVSHLVETVVSITLLMGVFLLATIYLVTPFLASCVFKIKSTDVSLMVSSLRMGGVGMLLRSVDAIILAVFQGYERYDLASLLNFPINFFMMVANLFWVFLGYDVPALIASSVIFIFCGIIAKVLVVNKIFCKKRLRILYIDKKIFWEIYSFALYSWTRDVSGILLNQADKIIIVSLLGTSALAYYNVCLQLTQQIHALLNKTFAFLFPLVTFTKLTGNKLELRQIYFNSLNSITVAAAAIGLPIFIFADNILTIWMGESFASHASILLKILAVVFTFWTTSIVPYYFMNGADFYRLNTVFGLIGGVLVTVLSMVLIPSLGIIGAPIARLMTLPTSLLGRTILHYNILGDRRWYAAFAVFFPLAILFGIAHILGRFVSIYVLASPVLLGLSSTLVAILSGTSIYLILRRINPVV